jgi:hypothetical protein
VRVADVQVSDGAYVRHLGVSRPHHFLAYLPDMSAHYVQQIRCVK